MNSEWSLPKCGCCCNNRQEYCRSVAIKIRDEWLLWRASKTVDPKDFNPALVGCHKTARVMFVYVSLVIAPQNTWATCITSHLPTAGHHCTAWSNAQHVYSHFTFSSALLGAIIMQSLAPLLTLEPRGVGGWSSVKNKRQLYTAVCGLFSASWLHVCIADMPRVSPFLWYIARSSVVSRRSTYMRGVWCRQHYKCALYMSACVVSSICKIAQMHLHCTYLIWQVIC